jgi:hypothetical protein
MHARFRETASHALGAEIEGVDLAKPLSNAEFDQIHRTFLERGILLFRDQKITREQHIAFSRRFGELDTHESLPRDRHPDYPELLLVSNIPKDNGKPSDSKYTGAMAFRPVVHAVPSLGRCCAASPSRRSAAIPCSPTCTRPDAPDGMKKLIEACIPPAAADRRPGSDRAAEQRKHNLRSPSWWLHHRAGAHIGEKVSASSA